MILLFNTKVLSVQINFIWICSTSTLCVNHNHHFSIVLNIIMHEVCICETNCFRKQFNHESWSFVSPLQCTKMRYPFLSSLALVSYCTLRSAEWSQHICMTRDAYDTDNDKRISSIWSICQLCMNNSR